MRISMFFRRRPTWPVVALGLILLAALAPALPAQEEKADMIGLSGLITPSLDEMVRVAASFRALRRGFAPGYEVADWLEGDPGRLRQILLRSLAKNLY